MTCYFCNLNKDINIENKKQYNFDISKNYLIKGDNLDVLYAMQDTYKNKIKLIYIDPPYNTKTKRNYKDNFLNHENWLTFMYPRLTLARELLSDDGVIFVSIDDNEQAQLKILMDGIFGSNNFISMITVESTITQGMKVKAAKAGKIVKNCEYLIIYSKNISNVNFNILYTKKQWDDHYSIYYEKNTRQTLVKFLNNDKNLKEFKKEHNIDCISKKDIIKLYNNNIQFREYIHTKSSRIYRDAEIEIDFKNLNINSLKEKQIIKYDGYLIFKNKNNKIRQLLPLSKAIGETDDFESNYGLRTIKGNLWKGFHKDMMNIDKEGDIKFQNGKKPKRLIKHMLQIATKPEDNDIILDFFAGSGTTGHAVLEKNLEDKGNRKFILIQNDEKSIHKDYNTIFDVCNERLKRAYKHNNIEIDYEVL